MAKDRPKIGLALSGGGSRGLAHIGVLKVLERQEIPVNYLAGTSMGGLIAAGFAAGLSADFMEQEALRITRYSQLARFFDLYFLGAGLLEGRKVHKYLSQHLGERTFADLRIPLALIAVDLITGQEVAITEGSVVEAVRATISMPGILAPMRLRDRLLVDGGLLNNLPADVVRHMGAEVVIAVDTSIPLEALPEIPNIDDRRLPFSQVSFTIQTLRRALGVIMFHQLNQRLAQARPEVLIRPALDRDVSLFSGFSRTAEIIAAGEKAAVSMLPLIKEACGLDPG